jgi:hypothetical protein
MIFLLHPLVEVYLFFITPACKDAITLSDGILTNPKEFSLAF